MSRLGAKDWQTSTAYVIDDQVYVNDKELYRCIISHTSGASFVGDIANWRLIADADTVSGYYIPLDSTIYTFNDDGDYAGFDGKPGKEMYFGSPTAGYLNIGDFGGLIIADNRVTKLGVEYAADYSANFTDRSLVDKAYVDKNKVVDNTDVASAANVGMLRYRVSGNNSYVDMSMQTGAGTYAWVNIVQNNW